MKTIGFSTSKRILLTFEAEQVSFSPEPGGLLLQAQGTITYQDMPPVEEMLAASGYKVTMRVEENGAELMNADFAADFLALEPEMLAVRLLAA